MVQAAKQHPSGAAGRAGVDWAHTCGNEEEGPGVAGSGRAGRQQRSTSCTVEMRGPDPPPGRRRALDPAELHQIMPYSTIIAAACSLRVRHRATTIQAAARIWPHHRFWSTAGRHQGEGGARKGGAPPCQGEGGAPPCHWEGGVPPRHGRGRSGTRKPECEREGRTGAVVRERRK